MVKIVPAIEKMNMILELIAESTKGIGFTKIVEESGINKSTVYSILGTLEHFKYIRKNESGYYVIDFRLGYLGEKYSENYKLRELFKENGEYLVSTINESCQLGVLNGIQIRYLAKVESKSNIKISTKPGLLLPAYATALGKMMLTKYSDEQLEILFNNMEFQPLSKNTVKHFGDLKKQIQFARSNGYIIERGEAEEGLFCVAAPIQNMDQEIVAAVSVTALDTLFDEKINMIIQAVLNLADQISSSLRGEYDEITK